MVQSAIDGEARSLPDGLASPASDTAGPPRPPRTRPMRRTLAALLIIPLVSLVALWAFAASITLSSALHEHDYNRLIALSSTPTDNLVNQVSQERLRTFTWLSTDPRPSAAQLAASRHRTDAAVTAYLRMLQQTAGLRPGSEGPAQASLVRLLSRLPRIRASVDAETLSPAVAFQAYSAIMDAVFAVYSASEQVNTNLSVDRQTDASMDAAQGLEYASREAALVGGAAGAHGQMTTSERQLFANAVANQRLLLGSALGEFDPQLGAPWERVYHSPLHHQLAALENRIAGSIGSKGPIPVNIGTWQSVSRAFLDGLQKAQIQDGPPLAAMASLAAATGWCSRPPSPAGPAWWLCCCPSSCCCVTAGASMAS